MPEAVPDVPAAPAVPARHWSAPLAAQRAVITLLVVAHHAVLAYHPDAPPVPETLDGANRWWGAFPIVDAVRFPFAPTFVLANEMYFMALMFLLSGLFAWPALSRKGAAAYARDRALRLGLPFAVSVTLLAPLAYYPTFLQTGAAGGWPAFLEVWTKPGVMSSGPAWFLWVLLAFDLVLAGVFAVAPSLGDGLGRAVARLRTPGALFAVWSALAVAAFLPLEFAAGGMTWWKWGPFLVQASRVLLYFVYFALGVALGAQGVAHGVFAEDGPLASSWKRWQAIAGVAFVAAVAAIIAVFTVKPVSFVLHVLADACYAIAGVAISMASLATFLGFVRGRQPFFAALVPCAYGIYLVHYPIVTFLQFAMLRVSLPGGVKAAAVTAGAIAASWAVVALLRRVPGVARVL